MWRAFCFIVSTGQLTFLDRFNLLDSLLSCVKSLLLSCFSVPIDFSWPAWSRDSLLSCVKSLLFSCCFFMCPIGFSWHLDVSLYCFDLLDSLLSCVKLFCLGVPSTFLDLLDLMTPSSLVWRVCFLVVFYVPNILFLTFRRFSWPVGLLDLFITISVKSLSLSCFFRVLDNVVSLTLLLNMKSLSLSWLFLTFLSFWFLTFGASCLHVFYSEALNPNPNPNVRARSWQR